MLTAIYNLAPYFDLFITALNGTLHRTVGDQTGGCGGYKPLKGADVTLVALPYDGYTFVLVRQDQSPLYEPQHHLPLYRHHQCAAASGVRKDRQLHPDLCHRKRLDQRHRYPHHGGMGGNGQSGKSAAGGALSLRLHRHRLGL